MSRVDFLRIGDKCDVLNCEGQVPVWRDKLTMDRMVGVIAGPRSLRRGVGMGSRSQ